MRVKLSRLCVSSQTQIDRQSAISSHSHRQDCVGQVPVALIPTLLTSRTRCSCPFLAETAGLVGPVPFLAETAGLVGPVSFLAETAGHVGPVSFLAETALL